MPELKHIACIDDEPDILEIASFALEQIGGFQVSRYADAREALKALPHSVPDLILLDVMMPGMDGPGVLKEIRKISALEQVPVVFMTAKVRPNEVNDFLRLGAADVIAKPFDPMELTQQVRKAWNGGADACR